jgi:uncharacterized integral membrane protein
MLALLLFIAFGLLFGYFATLNTSLVSVSFGAYTLANTPMYLLILASLGIGVLFAMLFNFFRSLGTGLQIGRLEKEVADAKKEAAELTKKNHQLELENTRLKAEGGEQADDDSL